MHGESNFKNYTGLFPFFFIGCGRLWCYVRNTDISISEVPLLADERTALQLAGSHLVTAVAYFINAQQNGPRNTYEFLMGVYLSNHSSHVNRNQVEDLYKTLRTSISRFLQFPPPQPAIATFYDEVKGEDQFAQNRASA